MNEKFFSPFTSLSTERLLLRQLRVTDDMAISALRSDERVNQYIKRQKQLSIDGAKAFVEKINNSIAQSKCLYWAICLKDNPDLIGTICLWNFTEDETTAEVGYELNPSFHKQGIMTEALSCIIHYGFQIIGFKMLEALTNKDNESSVRLLEKHHFIHDTNRKYEDDGYFIIFTLNRQG